MGGVEYQVTKVDPTDPETKGMVYQVHKVTEEVAATLGGKVYRARIIKDPTEPTVAGKVYQIVLIDDPDDPSVKGKVYNAILTGGSEAVVVGPAPSPLSLPDAIADSLSYVKAFGGTEQNGTPTPDTPVDIVSNNGVLKFSLNEFDSNAVELGYYRNANTGAKTESPYNFLTAMMPVKPSTSYVLFGRRKSDNHLSAYNRIYWFDSNQNFISTSSYSVNTVTIATSPANAAYAQGGINESGGTSIPTTQEIVDDYNWVFQQGTAEVPYTPYVEGGLYTDGTVETIGVYGDNLIDLSAVTDGYYYDPQGNYTSLSAARLTDYIPIEAGKDVKIYFKSLSTTSNLNVRINIFNSSKVWQSQEVLSLDPLADGTKTITPADNGYIRVSGNYSGGAIVDWNTASITESSCSATAEMLLKVGDYQDVQEIISGAITRNVGVKVLDGTESYQLYGSGAELRASTTIAGKHAAQTGVSSLMCSHFAAVADTTAGGVIGGQINCDSNPSYPTTIRIGINGLATTVAQFQQYLAAQYAAGTPVIVIYPLATPTTESVAGQTLQVQDGDNTLEITQASIDGLELEAEYEKEA